MDWHLTHWGWVMHICFSELTIIGSDKSLSPCQHQAIIWTNAGILLIGPLGTNFIEILMEIQIFSLKKMHLKITVACEIAGILSRSQRVNVCNFWLNILLLKYCTVGKYVMLTSCFGTQIIVVPSQIEYFSKSYMEFIHKLLRVSCYSYHSYEAWYLMFFTIDCDRYYEKNQ